MRKVFTGLKILLNNNCKLLWTQIHRHTKDTWTHHLHTYTHASPGYFSAAETSANLLLLLSWLPLSCTGSLSSFTPFKFMLMNLCTGFLQTCVYCYCSMCMCLVSCLTSQRHMGEVNQQLIQVFYVFIFNQKGLHFNLNITFICTAMTTAHASFPYYPSWRWRTVNHGNDQNLASYKKPDHMWRFPHNVEIRRCSSAGFITHGVIVGRIWTNASLDCGFYQRQRSNACHSI